MAIENITKFFDDKNPKPNKFTTAMGELIKKAREEAELSQSDLAELIYRRRATISDFESGKHEPDASTLALLAAALKKPIQYFFPKYVSDELPLEELSPKEKELLIIFRDAWDENMQQLIIDISKTLSRFDPENMLINSVDVIYDRTKRSEELANYLKNRRK